VDLLSSNSLSLPLLGTFPASPAAVQADLDGLSVYDAVPELASAAREMVNVLEMEYEK